MSDGWKFGRESVLAGSRSRVVGGGPAFSPAKDKYTVETAIGRGGMGEILLVTDQDLRRQVAMKVLLPEAAGDEESRLHFVAEAQATSQLEHPGIPPVHDIGVTADGRLYFTMKLVRGRTLREILHDLVVRRAEVQREWTLHRLVSVLERMCETLHFAHERGVVHRDLKPENVMLGDYGEVHVMDWGLARIGVEVDTAPGAQALAEEAERVRTARTEAARHSTPGTIKGTLPYMAPEQLSGTADRRTDVYALGLLLYEVLTLHPAFDPHAPGLLAQVASGGMPPAEDRNLRRPVPASGPGRGPARPRPCPRRRSRPRARTSPWPARSQPRTPPARPSPGTPEPRAGPRARCGPRRCDVRTQDPCDRPPGRVGRWYSHANRPGGAWGPRARRGTLEPSAPSRRESRPEW